MRFALLRRRTRWDKLVLVMQILDQLERDYHDIYPEDPPVIDEGFEEALKNVVLKVRE